MTATRRDVLASFLGIPAALAACRRGDRRDYRGAIVGAAVDVGHRLRDPGALPTGSPPGAPERVPVAILGAGPAGLSAAWRLSRQGFDGYVVLDLEDAPGGTSRAGRNRVSAYPWGAHYVPTPTAESRALVALLREMGVVEGVDADGAVVVGEQFLVRDPDERVYQAGVWHDGLYLYDGASRDDLRQLARFQAVIDGWVAWRDGRGRRAFALPMALGSDDPAVTALDAVSMADWMSAQGFDSPRLRWLVDYACRDDYGLRAARASAWAGVFYFASRIPRPGAPSAELIAWPEGNGALVRHLAGAAGGRVRLGTLATRVAPSEDGGVRVTTVDARTGRAAVLRADQVIVATPRFVARRIVAPLEATAPLGSTAAGDSGFTYSPWMVANVTLRDRPRSVGAPLAWDNVLYDSPSLGYVTATHQTLRDHGPTVLTYYYPLTGADVRAERARLLATGWREWADVVVTDLARAHPGFEALVESVDVYRWGHAMVRPVPGFAWSAARTTAAAPVAGRIFFAHSDLSALALFEEAQYRGVAAAEAVLAARGTPAPTLL